MNLEYEEIRIELGAEEAAPLRQRLEEEELPFQEADPDTLDPAPPGRVRFHLYVPPGEGAALLAALGAQLPAAAAVETRARREDEWRDAWKRHFGVLRIGRLSIVPSWEAERHVPAPGEVRLRLDPGRAFGTGGHESTRLCLRLLAEVAEAGPLRAVLDVGCGSGVLAIAALLLCPAARALAVDIDPEALEVTRENAELNGVLGRLAIAGTPAAEVPGEYALLLANLSGPTLVELAPALRRRLGSGGRLLVSGLLGTEAAAVRRRFTDLGLSPLREEREGEWAALLFERGREAGRG